MTAARALCNPLNPVRRLALARFLSLSGTEGAFFVGLWGRAAYEFEADAATIAPLLLALEVSWLLGSAIGGPLVDRYDPRRVLLVGELCAAPAALALILPDTLGGLAATVAAGGFLGGVIHTASASFAPYLTADPRRLGAVNASLEIADSGASIAGAALAAVIAGIGGLSGIAWVFVFDAVTSLGAAALVVGLAIRRITPAHEEEGGVRELVAGVRVIAASGVLRFTLALSCITFLSWGLYGVLEPLFFRDAVGVGVAALGAVNAVFGVGLLLGSVLARRLLTGGVSPRLLTVLVLMSGFGAVLYTGTAELAVVAVGAVVWGAVIGLFVPAQRTLVQTATPAGLVGRVTGVMGVAESGGELLPALAFASLGLAASAQPLLVGSGIVLMAAAAAALPLAARQ